MAADLLEEQAYQRGRLAQALRAQAEVLRGMADEFESHARHLEQSAGPVPGEPIAPNHFMGRGEFAISLFMTNPRYFAGGRIDNMVRAAHELDRIDELVRTSKEVPA